MSTVESHALEDRFIRAWSAAGQPDDLPRDLMLRLMQRGWTAEVVGRVIRLAEHARAVGAAFAWDTSTDDNRPAAPHRVRAWFFQVAEEAARQKPMPVVLGWLEALAVEADADRARWLVAALSQDMAPVWGSRRNAAVADSWSTRLGPLAGLAWLSGLDLDEAAALAANGALSEEALRTMAALRGYRLS